MACSLTLTFAQGPDGPPDGPPPGGPKKERVEAMKVAFITQKLDLSPEEAKVFWPVYNQYQDELEQLRKNRRENAKQNMDDLSNAEIEKMVDGEIGYRQAELDLLKKYHPQLKKVLPIRKVARLYRAEEEFKRQLLEMIQDRKDGRGGPQGGAPSRGR